MKIRSKLFVLLVSLILTSLLAASFVSINVLSTAMIREINAHLEDDSANLMNIISMNTSDRISDITFLGDSMNIFLNQSGSYVDKFELLKKFIGTHRDYSSISIYNKTGIKIADNKGIGIGENVSNESFFKKAIQGYIYRDSTTSNYLKSSKEKEIVLSGPLYDKSGKINEILVLSYPLNINIIEQASTGSRANLRINLLSDDGKVIYSNYDNRSLSNASAASSFDDVPIYRLIKDSNNTVESAIFKDIRSPSGNAIFVAAKESSNSQNPDSIKNKWLLVTSLDTQEAFKEVLSLRNMFIFITVIVLAISIIAIYIVVDRTISTPLTRLKDAAIEMGKGNLDLVISPPSTIDEIGDLSSQFGKMRARIKARTEELMSKDKELETANQQLKEKESILEKANEELKSLDRLKDEFITNQASTRRYLISSLIGLFIISGIIIIFLNSKQRSLFTNLPETIAAGFTLGLCLLIIYRRKIDGLHDKTHMFLTLGVGLWFVAETIYTYYQLALRVTTPFPSLADPVYLAGYVFFGYYLYSILKLLRKTIQRDVIILVSIAAAVSVTYILNLSFGIGLLLADEEDKLRTTLSITYPILDSILFVPALLVLWSVRKGDLAHTHWILISLFIILNGIGDIGFGYDAVLGTVGNEEWIWDIFYNAGYLTLASALFWQSSYLYSSSIIVRENNDMVKENNSND